MATESTFIQILVMSCSVIGMALFALWVEARQAKESAKD